MNTSIIHCFRRYLTVISLLVCAISACRATPYREVIAFSVTIPLLSYLRAQPAGSGVNNVMADFPAVEVFNGAGQLVYLGHDAASNVALVESLPGGLDRLTVLPDQQSLFQVIEYLPGLTERDKEALRHNRRPTVITFSLEDCPACSFQKESLGSKTATNLTAHGLNSLAILVSRPH